MIALMVSITTFLGNPDPSISAVAGYPMANAIVVPISEFLSKAIGRERHIMISIASVGAASLT